MMKYVHLDIQWEMKSDISGRSLSNNGSDVDVVPENGDYHQLWPSNHSESDEPQSSGAPYMAPHVQTNPAKLENGRFIGFHHSFSGTPIHDPLQDRSMLKP